MLHSPDLDFSYSGLKTAVRYAIGETKLTETEIARLARDFEDAAIATLVGKLTKAVRELDARSVILGGGVAANNLLRAQVQALPSTLNDPELKVHLPTISLSTDNSVMIALAGHAHLASALSPRAAEAIRAVGNRTLGTA